jgi:hypothetical protein
MAGSDGSGMEDDDGYTVGLWLHDDRSRWEGRWGVSWMISDGRVARVADLTRSCGDGPLSQRTDAMQLVTRRSR